MTGVDGIVLVESDSYPPDGPLLWYLRRLGASLGLPVANVGRDEAIDGRPVVAGHGSASRSAVAAAASELPLVLFSPFLDDPDVVEALTTTTGSGLVVGSAADPRWDPRAAARLTQVEVLQVPGADHLLEIPGDAIASIRLLERIMIRCDALLRHLA